MNPVCRLPPWRGVRHSRPLLLLVLVVACAPALHPIPEHPQADPDLLLGRMHARQAGLDTISAVGRAESRTRDGTFRGRVTVLADKAGRIRVDAWTSTDVLVAFIGAGPDGFTYFQRGNPECLVGPTCQSNLGRFLPQGWDLTSLAHALMGIAPLRPVIHPWRLSFDRRVGAYLLQSSFEDAEVQRLWLREDGTALAYERSLAGNVLLRLEIAEPATTPGLPARKIIMKGGAGDSELAIRYQDIETNPQMDPGDWTVDCPESNKIRVMPCEGEP